MLKDFQKYSKPDDKYDHPFQDHYIPDELLEAAINPLKQSPQILNLSRLIKERSDVDVFKTQWLLADSIDHVTSVWSGLNGIYAEMWQRAIDNNRLYAVHDHKGKGGGFEYEGKVCLETTGTIIDPVRLAHESGHLLPSIWGLSGSLWTSKNSSLADFFNEQRDHVSPKSVITEIQSHFIEENSYEHFLKNTSNKKQNDTIRLLKLSRYVGTLSAIPSYIWLVDRLQNRIADNVSLRSAMTAWSIKDKKIIMNREKRIAEDNSPEDMKVRSLHSHCFAMLLSTPMFEKFKQCDIGKQKQMLKVLYEGGANTTLDNILHAFDIQTAADIGKAASRTVDVLYQECEYFNFRPGVFQRLLNFIT